ncbi:MAG: Rne/Rng family ribonuclease [Planctomycetota bacterium]
MIINVVAGEECRVAILEEGRLEELHLERQSAESHVGNIYKGRVTNVEPSIQAAFVDFGLSKNGFLHISDVQPKYFPNGPDRPAGKPVPLENVGKKVPRRDRPSIHKCFRRGQEVIVQITKEGVGTKGPTLTTYLSIPGRYLVMMPGMSRLGVSRKIEDEEARTQMRNVLHELVLPEGIGFILRTAGLDRTKRDLQRDLNYLNRLWKIVEDRMRETRVPAELYQESDLVIRTIRDLYTPDFDRIVMDHRPTAQKASEFMQIAMPRAHDVIELYEGTEPIFHKYGIEAEIERINSRHVPLSSGGSIVIESTEAMVTIDVNSGRFRSLDDAEETAFQINLEAAKEIARQLRLRDLGGLVVCDFIDLRLDRHKRAVERTLRDELKKHKERARILRMSQFGLIEMTRQRQRPSIKRSIYADCRHCRGTGVVKTLETMVLEVIRVLQLAAHKSGVAQVALSVSPEVAVAVLNQRRAVLHKLEQETGTTVVVTADPAFGIDQLAPEFRDDRGRIISVDLS